MKRIFLTMVVATGLLWACGGGETPSEAKDTATAPAKEEKPMTEEEMRVEAVSLEIATIGETMTEMAYSPKQISVPASAEVTLTLTNNATAEAMIHNLVVIKPGQQTAVNEAAMAAGPDANYLPDADMYIAATSMANPGETVEVVFTAPSKKGTYQYICTYPGHTAMKGLMVVK